MNLPNLWRVIGLSSSYERWLSELNHPDTQWLRLKHCAYQKYMAAYPEGRPVVMGTVQ